MAAHPTYRELVRLAMDRKHIQDDQLFVSANGWILVRPPIWKAEGKHRMYNQAAERWRAQYGAGSSIYWFLNPIHAVRVRKKEHGRHPHDDDMPRRYQPFPGPIYEASRGVRTAALVGNIRVDEADRYRPMAAGILEMIQSTQYGPRGSAGVLVWK